MTWGYIVPYSPRWHKMRAKQKQVVRWCVIATVIQFTWAMHVTHREPPITCKTRKLKSGIARETCKPDYGQPVYTFWGIGISKDRLKTWPWPYNYWTDPNGNIADPERNRKKSRVARTE